ncbi:MAG: phosphatidate cytidylyltransferase [Candidatus Nanopelagicales bacterium]|nr:phosphatidate cytidylyltransferase [Candidatus Nanopelagicales bacterium]
MTVNEPDYGRAGRNLPVAIAVGLGLFATVIASLFIDTRFFAILAAFGMMLAARELGRTLVVGLSERMSILLQILSPAIIVGAAIGGPVGLLGTFVASSLLVLAVRLLDGQEAYVHHVTRSIYALAYAPLLAGFAVLLSTQENGAWKVLAFILLTAATDLGGYAAGAIFGKHPMAPNISPNKSWEGFAGALILQLIVGVSLWVYVFEQPWWQGAIVGFVMMLTATIGDLVESMIKRDVGIKDMGGLLPGHGGVMDRLDSLVVNAFMAWLLFGFFL